MSPNELIDLKPCPFCGGEAESSREPGYIWRVTCRNHIKCRAVVRVDSIIRLNESVAKEEAENIWNNRAGDKQ